MQANIAAIKRYIAQNAICFINCKQPINFNVKFKGINKIINGKTKPSKGKRKY